MVPVDDAGGEQVREWRPDFRLDLAGVLAPLRRGRGDPTWRSGDGPPDEDRAPGFGSAVWRTGTTPDGAATMRLHRRSDGTVVAAAWGPGAAWTLQGLPDLLGARDRPDEFVAHHPLVADAQRRMPGLRFGASGRVWDVLLPAVLEQKVTGMEARRAWRTLLYQHGTPAPGPTPVAMRVPPSAQALRDVPTWDWHRMGVDIKRQQAIRGVAAVAHRLEESTADNVLTRLRLVPGVGQWTAAETAQRAFGHPDAVSVGDYHVKNWVVYALTGRPRGTDEEMVELLAPWIGHRQRVVRLIELTGNGAPRFGPRFSPNDIRAI